YQCGTLLAGHGTVVGQLLKVAPVVLGCIRHELGTLTLDVEGAPLRLRGDLGRVGRVVDDQVIVGSHLVVVVTRFQGAEDSRGGVSADGKPEFGPVGGRTEVSLGHDLRNVGADFSLDFADRDGEGGEAVLVHDQPRGVCARG